MIPFGIEQLLGVYATYNEAVFPAQLVLMSLGGIGVILSTMPGRFSSRVISMVLALLWSWAGAIYHLIFLTRLDETADILGIVFLLQAALFASAGIGGRLEFSSRASSHKQTGGTVILYAVVIHPILGMLAGRSYPGMPTFGVPCPMMIFTFGLLLWTIRRPPLYLYVIPILWSVLSLPAALVLGMYEDIGLFISALFGVSALGGGTRAREYITERYRRSRRAVSLGQGD